MSNFPLKQTRFTHPGRIGRRAVGAKFEFAVKTPRFVHGSQVAEKEQAKEVFLPRTKGMPSTE